jgi:hypothetical protein
MTFSQWVDKWVAQMAHLGWGSFLALLLSEALPTSHHIPLFALWLVTAFATIKEAVFDPLTETLAEQGSGLEDWAFWMLGNLIGSGSFLLLQHWGR